MNLFAHFTNAGVRTGCKATLRLTTDCAGRDVVATLAVSGKKEARTIAAAHNAKPWNF